MNASRQPESDNDFSTALEKARHGDRAAFDLLVRNYANMVTGLAFRMLGSQDEALDCAQDAFVRAWENISRYDPKWSIATWLRRIVTNLALDRLRRRRSHPDLQEAFEETLPSGGELPDAAAERREEAAVVRDVIEDLPDKYRVVIVLRDMEGVDIAEIARITGANSATVRWRLHRARAIFRDRWLALNSREP